MAGGGCRVYQMGGEACRDMSDGWGSVYQCVRYVVGPPNNIDITSGGPTQ
jgi:hypothetical protein